jgi:hypothetical protein
MADDKLSELFGYLCECTDPRATHQRAGLDGEWGACFVMSCRCNKYKMDNLKHLERVVEEREASGDFLDIEEW